MNIVNIQLVLKKILVMVLLMTCIAGSFIAIMTYRNIGWADNFFNIWSRSLMFAVVVMMPLGGGIMYIANRIVKSLFSHSSLLVQNILVGLLMGLTMESIMAVSTTYNVAGFIDISSFLTVWLNTFAAAIPAAIIFAPIMTILIKPKLEAFMAKEA